MMKYIKRPGSILLAFFLSLVSFSCLDDKGYTDIVNSKNGNQVVLSWYGTFGTTDNKAVALPGGDGDADYVATISVTSASGKLKKDFPVTVAVDPSVIDAVNATIELEANKFTLMPEDTYDIPNFEVTIPADTTEAEFVVTFHQGNIDKGKNYILPLVIQDQDGAIVGNNVGTLKLTFIGNPLAGAYTWDFTRYNCTGQSSGCVLSSSTSFTGEPTIFSPQDGTSFKVQTGYFTAPNYLVTFKNDGGVLSNFTAVIAPDEIKAAFTDNGITVVDGPTITVNEDYTVFTIHYVVFNGAAYRDCTDVYYK